LLTSGDLGSWDLVQQWDPKNQRFSMSPDALVATLVDGRDADLVTMGKIAEAIIPAVNKLAQVNQGLFLESSRRELNNEIATMEREVEEKRGKIQEKERQLSVIESKLPSRS
jgi:hypothetical protein